MGTHCTISRPTTTTELMAAAAGDWYACVTVRELLSCRRCGAYVASHAIVMDVSCRSLSATLGEAPQTEPYRGVAFSHQWDDGFIPPDLNGASPNSMIFCACAARPSRLTCSDLSTRSLFITLYAAPPECTLCTVVPCVFMVL